MNESEYKLLHPHLKVKLSKEDIRRFFTKFKKSGPNDCWLWLGGKCSNGYGKFHCGGRAFKAHRVSWTVTNGPIPDSLNALHDCPNGDNPLCVNPNHLWLGTTLDNIEDRNSKGRQVTCGGKSAQERCGIKCNMAKLNDDEVRQIRMSYTAGGRSVVLAKHFGVSRKTIQLIVTRTTWKHVA